MSRAGEERFVFEAEWHDTQASLIRKYLLTFFPGDKTIEMVRINFIYYKYLYYTNHQCFSYLIVIFYVNHHLLLQYDLKLKKVFLKRMACPGVSFDELYIGSVITIYSRQLMLAEYGDLFTRQKFDNKKQRTFAMIKPDAYISTGKIINAIQMSGFMISKMKMTRLSQETAGQFYAEHRGKPFFNDLT